MSDNSNIAGLALTNLSAYTVLHGEIWAVIDVDVAGLLTVAIPILKKT